MVPGGSGIDKITTGSAGLKGVPIGQGPASLVSVLLPCRDAAEHLAAAAGSLERQSLRNFEVVAVDDGSRDDTGEILHRWARRDPRVRAIERSRAGLVPALQAAAAAAQGDLLARMDADDLAHPRRLELQARLLARRPELAACGTGVRYFPRSALRGGALRYERWLAGLSSPQRIAAGIFVECPIPHPTLMVRRSAFAAVGGYRDPGWPEDYDLILRLWSQGARLAKVARVLLLWRERPGRTSWTDPRYSPDAFRRCKVHHLRRTLLAPPRTAVVWGAGPVGKAMARALLEAGTRVEAFVDLDPRKIGQTIHDAPVVRPADVPLFPGALVLGAVGSPGARAEIRREARRLGLRELKDFVAVA